jgi:hypothetical protein
LRGDIHNGSFLVSADERPVEGVHQRPHRISRVARVGRGRVRRDAGIDGRLREGTGSQRSMPLIVSLNVVLFSSSTGGAAHPIDNRVTNFHMSLRTRHDLSAPAPSTAKSKPGFTANAPAEPSRSHASPQLPISGQSLDRRTRTNVDGQRPTADADMSRSMTRSTA